MNDQQLISHIEELGLSNKEARVYVACLVLGPSAVQKIADHSGIKRVTTYVILESLVGLGLVSQSIKGKKTYFVGEDPSNLERLLDKREQELTEQKHSFDQILPALQGLKTVPKELPEVKFYDSSDGVRSLFANFFANYKGESRTIYVISNLDEVFTFWPERTYDKPNPDRVKYNISSKIIYTCKDGDVYKATDEKYDRVSRFVPASAYPIAGDISIIGDNVIIISYADSRSSAITIRNEEVAQAMKAMFDMCWAEAEQFNR